MFKFNDNLKLNAYPSAFRYLVENVLIPSGCTVENIVREAEGIEYDAIIFQINGMTTLYRQAKKTPKKLGHFVTLWKRENGKEGIRPFDQGDGISGVFVAVDEGDQLGFFVFSAQDLIVNNVFSTNSQGGKRAVRVYAPWADPVAIQAKKTQRWQVKHFIFFDKKSKAIDDGVSYIKNKLSQWH